MNKNYAIYNDPNFGPSFGVSDFDLYGDEGELYGNNMSGIFYKKRITAKRISWLSVSISNY